MADEFEDFLISGKEHRVYKKFQKHIENICKVKINMPRVASSDTDIVFISLNGEEACRNRAKKFVSDKMLSRVQQDRNVTIVTLSDNSDDESTSDDEDATETPPSKSTALSSNLLRDESVLIIEDSASPTLKTQEKATKRCGLLDDSICIIENPTNSLQQHPANTKRKKCRKNCKKSNKKARTEINICDQPLSISPASLQHSSGYIPVFDLGKNKSALNHQSRQCKMDEGEITVIEPCSVNKNNFLPLTIPSTQNQKTEVRKEKIITNVKNLRPVVIDGSNIAREHGVVSNCFSAKGIQLAINFFLNRGHTQVTAFVPMFRRHFNPKHSVPTMNPEILEELYKKNLVAFTPSRRINGKMIQSYDDRFIVELASSKGGVIVSNDNFRDLINEKESFKETIENRLLMFCFVGDEFMVPEDPLGRDGPKLAEFLSFPPSNEVT